MRPTMIVVPVAAGWSWPVDGPVLRPFSLAEDQYAAGQHRGLDLGAAVGEVVRSPVAGTISFAGSIPAGGRALTIQTADGYAVTLLQLGSIAVARGDAVAESAIVGAVGASEDAVTSAPHVHLGVRVAGEPNGYVDPLRLLPARAAASSPAAPVPVPVAVVVAEQPAAAATSVPPAPTPPAESITSAPAPAPAVAPAGVTAPIAVAQASVAAAAGPIAVEPARSRSAPRTVAAPTPTPAVVKAPASQADTVVPSSDRVAAPRS